MTSHRPLLRSHRILALAATGLLVAACSSDDSGGLGTPYAHYAPPTSGGSTSSGSTSGSSHSSSGTSNGATSSGSSSGSSTTSASSSGGSSGGSSSGGTVTPPPPVTPAFALALDTASPTINLADTSVVNVTITPESWSGAVALTVTGLPSDVTGAFDNATVNVDGTTPVTAKLTLTSVSSTAPVATPFNIVGTVGAVVKSSPATITVKSYITINIPVNADSVTASFGTVNITAPADIANNPVTVNFVNLDSTPHEIHAENPNQGFAHGLGTFGQGQADAPVRMVIATGSYDWHLHDDAPPGGPPGGTVVIQ